MAFYGKREYWDERYQEMIKSSITSEWYRGYGHLRHLLSPIHFATTGCTIKSNTTNSNPLDYHNKPNLYTFPDRSQARVLILGCGNSSFGADMLRDGWSGPIVNVDFSSVVIAAMEKKYGNHFYQHLGSSRVTNKMRFICADVTQPLPYDDASFDLIICKGVLDAILCSDGSKGNALSCIQECHRLMAPGHGILFVVTNGNPDNRLEYLEHRNSLSHYWRGVSVHTAPKQYQQEKTVYCYICRKQPTENYQLLDKENCVENSTGVTIINHETG